MTRSFRDTVRDRAERDPSFRGALFQEAIKTLLRGEIREGRVALRYEASGIGRKELKIKHLLSKS